MLFHSSAEEESSAGGEESKEVMRMRRKTQAQTVIFLMRKMFKVFKGHVFNLLRFSDVFILPLIHTFIIPVRKTSKDADRKDGFVST